jgi:hypothetical protein
MVIAALDEICGNSVTRATGAAASPPQTAATGSIRATIPNPIRDRTTIPRVAVSSNANHSREGEALPDARRKNCGRGKAWPARDSSATFQLLMGALKLMIRLSLLLLVPAAGCSSFNRDWRAAGAAIAPGSGMAGRWSGTWQSAVNGHQGQLRAILTPIDEDSFHARFRARFWGIMAYNYRLELEVQPTAPGQWNFEGDADLGWLAGGTFRCQGTASADDMQATFDSKRDHGTFTLSRITIEP